MTLAIVAGAGPGLGCSLLRRFAAGGYHVVGMARKQGDADGAEILAVDLNDFRQVADTTTRLVQDHGPPRIVIHNPAHFHIAPFGDTSPSAFEAAWRNMALSAFHLAQAVLPIMTEQGEGSLLISGATASLRGGKRFAAFASAKFALRGLAQSLAREYQPVGVHVAHLVIDGIMDTPASRAIHAVSPENMIDTKAVAEVFWQIAHQERSAWTHELDIRPQGESF